MPITQQGALNLSALAVADVYIVLVPPQLLLNGVPTNVLGLVGTGSWGPVNKPILSGNMQETVAKIGSVKLRNYDLSTYHAIAFQQGATVIQSIRVTDGTDVKASAQVQNTPVQATGSVAFTVQPTAAQTLTLNGTVVTFVASGATGTQVNIGANLAATLAALLAMLTASSDTQLVKFTYAVVGSSLNLTAATGGTAGNSLTVATNVTGATVTNMSGGAAATPGLTVTAKYSGTDGNGIRVTLSPGSAVGSTRVTVAMPNRVPERFDNITGVGNALWVNMAAAINQGQSGMRGPSSFITATAGTLAASATNATYPLTGGTDGVSGVTSQSLLGVDGTARTGMYALRGIGVSVAALCDATDTNTWATQIAFGAAEGIYMVMAFAASQSIDTVAATKATAGIDDPTAKLMFGDWIYWNDTTNGIPRRLVSPAAFEAGKLVALSPEQSTLNKPMQAIVGTERSESGLPYSTADLQILADAGVEVICNPIPYGAVFGARNGRNSSSNPAIHGDNYTRMSNYLAITLQQGMGKYIGKVITTTLMRQAKTTIDSFLQTLRDLQMIDNFSSTLDKTNNPDSRTGLGYLQADVQVRLGPIVEFFIVNLEAGQTVTVTKKTQIQN